MRCVILISSLLCLLMLNCSQNNDEVIYVYGKYNFNNNELVGQDTISLRKIGNSNFLVTFSNYEGIRDLQIQKDINFIKIIKQDISHILYSLKTDSIYTNSLFKKYLNPYYVNNTKFIQSKEFLTDITKYKVSMFRVNNYSTLTDFVYFSEEFGFLYFTEQGYYYRILKIINMSDDKVNKVKKLMAEVKKDSSFFAYPVKTKIHFKAPILKK